MTAISDWLALAHTDRGNTLIYCNYIFESDHAQLSDDLIKKFEAFLQLNSAKIVNYRSALREFTRRNSDVKTLGSDVYFPSSGLVAVFNANKAGRVLGLSPTFREILSGMPDPIYDRLPAATRPLIPDEGRKRAARLIESTIKRYLADFRRSTRPPVPATPPAAAKGSRKRLPTVRQTRGMPFDKYANPSEVIWVTSKNAARALYQKRSPGPDVALTMRRLLGLPTAFSGSLGGTSVDDFLYNLFFRVHLKKRSAVPLPNPTVLRKPTVFADGFDDVYGAYWSSPIGDGWGRTITLCAGDVLDGSEGLPEAVISLAHLECMHIISLGRIDREDTPGPLNAQVNVALFARQRHEVCLGTNCA